MALLDKFTATSIYNGRQFHYQRISQTRFRRDYIEQVGQVYNNMVEYFTEATVQDALIAGHLVITNPATVSDKFEEPELPSTFYFTSLSGVRYTAYIQDDVVSVVYGNGIRTETAQYPLSAVKSYIQDRTWKVLPESYRSRHSVVSEFMQYMESHQGPLTTEDRVAMAETIVLLNKVMYEMETK